MKRRLIPMLLALLLVLQLCPVTALADDAVCNHKYVNVAAVPRTCTEDGLTPGVKCSLCDYVLSEQVVLPAYGHKDDNHDQKCDRCEVAMECKHHTKLQVGYGATCTEDGLSASYVCAYCGVVMQAAKPIPAKGHKDEDIDFKCDVCGVEVECKHYISILSGKEPTCGEDGLTDGKYCSNCGVVFEEQQVIPATGHPDEDGNNQCDNLFCGEILLECVPLEEAVTLIRKAMIAREPIMVYFYTDEPLVEDTSERSEFMRDLVFQHTSVPEEGDSLAFSWWMGVLGCHDAGKGTDSEYRYVLVWQFVYFSDAQQEAELDTAVENLLASFNFGADTTDYEKIKTIYDYIRNHVECYATEEEIDGVVRSAYSALVKGRGVGAAIPALFYRLCLESGIDARVIEHHDEKNLSKHWNIVALDGKYYNVDIAEDIIRNKDDFLIGENAFTGPERDPKYDTDEFHRQYPMHLESYHIHTIADIPGVEPTCRSEGLSWGSYCTECGVIFTEQQVEPMTPHIPATVPAREGNCVENGYTEYQICGYCKIHLTEPTVFPAQGHVFENSVCTVCGFVFRFIDVYESDYYYTPVLWAVGKGITNGTTPYTFAPLDGCTRAQVVTFLWAANGRRNAQNTQNPFTDVKESDWYYNAVMWAVEQGITTGISADRFGPDQTCTRAQIVTFLYAMQGKPEIKGGSTFVDVADTDWFAKPVIWAAENGVTGGIGDGKFGPNNTCTRGQIVTFLYKVYGNK